MSKAVSCKCFNNDVKFYYNNSLEGTIDLDLDIMSINSIRLLVSEAHFHVDNIKITTSNDSYVLQETFDEDFLVPPDELVEYSYNQNDERVSKTVDGATTYYLTDGNGQVLSEYDDNNELDYNYLYALGRKMARMDGTNVQYFNHDYLGSVRQIINSNGTVYWERGYYPFGAERYAEGLDNDYKFTGKERDDEMGLDYSWHRYYLSGVVPDFSGAKTDDYELGRFTQVDPLWQKYPSLTPYNYCGNNPVKFVDPDGKIVVNPQKQVLGNTTLQSSLQKLDNLIVTTTGISTKDFTIEITGGDRYIGVNGGHYEIGGEGKLIPASKKGNTEKGTDPSDHLKSQAGTAVDISKSFGNAKVTVKLVRSLLEQAGLFESRKKYPKHLHLETPETATDDRYIEGDKPFIENEEEDN